MNGDEEESPWQPRVIRGETVWLTADGTHVLLPLAMFERYLGRSLAEAVDPPAASFDAGPELGMVLRRSASADDPTEEAILESAPTLVVSETTANLDLSEAGIDFDRTVVADHRPSPPSMPRPGWMVGALVGASFVLLALALGVWIGSDLRGQHPPPEVTHTAPVVPEPVKLEPTKVEVGVPEKATPVVSPPAEPKATPNREGAKATPRESRPAERTTVEFKPSLPSWRASIDEGWKLVERQPAAAAAAFKAALSSQPNDPDANYGYGYALLKLGDKPSALPYLCKARTGDTTTRREVTGVLQAHGLSCD